MAPMPHGTQNGLGAWLGLGAIVIILFAAASQCSTETQTPAQLAAAEFAQNTSQGIAAQTADPIEPMNRASLRQGLADMRAAIKAEGISGAMIYSQNCYEGLSRKFTWVRMDVCGAADMLAVQAVDVADSIRLSEIGYFESEVAAGRYLAAATSAGQDASEADQRLEKLKAQTRDRVEAIDPEQSSAENEDNGVSF
ncbi:hypothetical protein [Sphingobium lignivorans]|uniref:Uncharacterized protein n=1 Tax=Sphingobium lignivorans TaxID=2735886 RepID=A0ABR6NH38_9SPHN|nr:hypothetical protein [Sphingobium lignivorans]MBB5986597.1 hypothetical protein [Sphingobium lignivorans]